MAFKGVKPSCKELLFVGWDAEKSMATDRDWFLPSFLNTVIDSAKCTALGIERVGLALNFLVSDPTIFERT